MKTGFWSLYLLCSPWCWARSYSLVLRDGNGCHNILRTIQTAAVQNHALGSAFKSKRRRRRKCDVGRRAHFCKSLIVLIVLAVEGWVAKVATLTARPKLVMREVMKQLKVIAAGRAAVDYSAAVAASAATVANAGTDSHSE